MNIIATVKTFFKYFPLTKKIYAKLKQTVKGAKPLYFYNCSHNSDTVCLVLAGYKEYLWDIVFERLRQFIPENIDVCIVSSGLFSPALLTICQKNNWSYISMKRNCVTLALNTAIESFSFAQYIYKVDEDIFLTKNFFPKLRYCYDKCENDSDYFPAFVGPLIPVNGYGHLRILEKFSLKTVYSKQFEKPKYAAGSQRMIEHNPNTAIFLWGGANILTKWTRYARNNLFLFRYALSAFLSALFCSNEKYGLRWVDLP